MNDKKYNFDKSMSLFKRASDVIPGGIYGSKSPGFVIPGSFPYYFTEGDGCRLKDPDGNEYIDFLCAYGAQIFGYGYKPVEDEFVNQVRKGDLLNTPAPVMVELAEKVVETVKDMDWVVFGKNGTDMTTLAASLARVKTGKKKIIMAEGAYHGAANWCSTNDFPELEDKKDIIFFPYNNTEKLKEIFSNYKGQIAATFLTPYHHPTYKDSVMPVDGFYRTVESLCKKENAQFILDDIRANFRLSLNGSHSYFNCNPDMITMGKSIANGQPLSLLVGKEHLKKTASGFFITGTFWYSAGPMAAAVKALDEMKRLDIITHMNKMGTLLTEGLKSTAADAGYDINISGSPTIPFMTFKEDPDLYLNQQFCGEMTSRGIYLHPHHNWFISYAHGESEINQALETARVVFKEMRP